MDFRLGLWYYNVNNTKDVVPMRRGRFSVKE